MDLGVALEAHAELYVFREMHLVQGCCLVAVESLLALYNLRRLLGLCGLVHHFMRGLKVHRSLSTIEALRKTFRALWPADKKMLSEDALALPLADCIRPSFTLVAFLQRQLHQPKDTKHSHAGQYLPVHLPPAVRAFQRFAHVSWRPDDCSNSRLP